MAEDDQKRKIEEMQKRMEAQLKAIPTPDLSEKK